MFALTRARLAFCQGGAKIAEPEGPRLRGGKRAEARRAEAAGDRVQGKG